jgi:hypothetical protein
MASSSRLKKSPWLYAFLGVLAVIVVFGLSGHYTGCAPVDRLLVPHARHWGESVDGYLHRIASECAQRGLEAPCVDARMAEARQHGELP